MQTATLMISEPRAIVRAGLETLLRGVDWLEILGVEAEADAALKRLGELQPDLAVFGLGTEPTRGLDAAGRAAQVSPETRVILLVRDGRITQKEALATGAVGLVSEDEDAEAVEGALRAALQGRTWVSAGLRQDRAGAAPGGGESLAALSPRQRQVLRLMAEGLTTRQIAARLGRSIKTIETHRAQLMRRLGTRSVAELVKTAIRAGLVSLEAAPGGEPGS